MPAALQGALLIGTHRIEQKNNSHCTLQWPLGRLRGTKLESRDSQLSISNKDSRNRHNWSGMRPEHRKNGKIASNLVTAYIFSRLVIVTHAAEAHLLISNEPTNLDRFQAFRLDSKRLRGRHTVSYGFSHFTEFPHWGWVGYLLISYPFGIPGYKLTALWRAASDQPRCQTRIRYI